MTPSDSERLDVSRRDLLRVGAVTGTALLFGMAAASERASAEPTRCFEAVPTDLRLLGPRRRGASVLNAKLSFDPPVEVDPEGLSGLSLRTEDGRTFAGAGKAKFPDLSITKKTDLVLTFDVLVDPNEALERGENLVSLYCDDTFVGAWPCKWEGPPIRERDAAR
jgi:hypothetical protein